MSTKQVLRKDRRISEKSDISDRINPSAFLNPGRNIFMPSNEWMLIKRVTSESPKIRSLAASESWITQRRTESSTPTASTLGQKWSWNVEMTQNNRKFWSASSKMNQRKLKFQKKPLMRSLHPFSYLVPKEKQSLTIPFREKTPVNKSHTEERAEVKDARKFSFSTPRGLTSPNSQNSTQA